METVETFIFDKFKALFNNYCFPVIAPQEFIETIQPNPQNQNTRIKKFPFCVFNIVSVQKQVRNCNQNEEISIQFLLYALDYNKIEELRKSFIEIADEIGKMQSIRTMFDNDLIAYYLIIEYDFLFNSGSLKGK